MRYNTTLKRLKYRDEMINYLMEFPGYTLDGSVKLTDHWIKNGKDGTLEVYHEDISNGLCHIMYWRKQNKKNKSIK